MFKNVSVRAKKSRPDETMRSTITSLLLLTEQAFNRPSFGRELEGVTGTLLSLDRSGRVNCLGGFERGVVHSKIRQARKANRINRKAKREKERKRKSDLGGPPPCKG